MLSGCNSHLDVSAVVQRGCSALSQTVDKSFAFYPKKKAVVAALIFSLVYRFPATPIFRVKQGKLDCFAESMCLENLPKLLKPKF